MNEPSPEIKKQIEEVLSKLDLEGALPSDIKDLPLHLRVATLMAMLYALAKFLDVPPKYTMSAMAGLSAQQIIDMGLLPKTKL
jgi:hypothetical protein